jgi:hypothetical protein
MGRNRHTDTNETFRSERSEENIRAKVIEGGLGVDDGLRRIKRSLLGDTLGEDGGLGDAPLQARFFLEDTFQLSRNLKRQA